MNYNLQKENHYLLITMHDEKINSVNAPALKSELIVIYNSHGDNNLILDLGAIRYIDSSGLSAILVAHRLCKEANKILVLCNLNDTVMDLVKISQLTSVLNITHTLNEAKDFVVMNELENSLLNEEDISE